MDVASSGPEFDDPSFLARLRRGEDAAYRALIRRFHTRLVNVATALIGSHAQAEEVVQDAWMAVHAGIARFEGRSSLTTWIFAIVLNRARTRAARESRTVALPPILDGLSTPDPVMQPGTFKADGHWVETPALWDDLSPERVVAGQQLWRHVTEVIETLPAGQKAVITLRDLEGQDAETVCELLEISPENQRVLLHRARGRVRQAIDRLLRAPAGRGGGATPGAPHRAWLARIIDWWRPMPSVSRSSLIAASR